MFLYRITNKKNNKKYIGITNDYKQAILSSDKDHYIYAKMNPNTVNRVRDFYRSFN